MYGKICYFLLHNLSNDSSGITITINMKLYYLLASFLHRCYVITRILLIMSVNIKKCFRWYALVGRNHVLRHISIYLYHLCPSNVINLSWLRKTKRGWWSIKEKGFNKTPKGFFILLCFETLFPKISFAQILFSI